jgi:hypothetical protein
MGITLGRVGGQQPGQLPEGLADIADRLGVSHRTARRWHQHGLSETLADRHAVAASHLPRDIWPDWDDPVPPEDLAGTAAANWAKTTCPAGHAYDGVDGRGWRTCTPCIAERVRRHRAKTQVATLVTETAA